VTGEICTKWNERDRIEAFLYGEVEHEGLGETLEIALHRFIEPFGRHAVQLGQISVQHTPSSHAQYGCAARLAAPLCHVSRAMKRLLVGEPGADLGRLKLLASNGWDHNL
jgi:hypothetical protein